MKKSQKLISRVLVFLLVLGLLPSTAVIAAAEMTYSVLVQPTYQYESVSGASGSTAVVWKQVYEDTSVGRYITREEAEELYQANKPVERYRAACLVNIESGAFREISDNYASLKGPYVGGYYIAENRSNWLYGVIDQSGKVICDFQYTRIASITDDGYAIVVLEGEQYLVNLKTGVKTSPAVTINDEYNSGMMPQSNGSGNYMYVDINGNPVLNDQEYWMATGFHNGYAIVGTSSGVCVIDTSGKVVLNDGTKDYEINRNATVSKDGYVSCILRVNGVKGFVNIFDSEAFYIEAPASYYWFDDGNDYGRFENGYTVITWSDEQGYDYTKMAAIDSTGKPIDLGGLDCASVSDTGIVWIRNSEGKFGAVQLSFGSVTETSEAETLPNAVRYVPYQYKLEGSANAGFTLTKGTLPQGMRVELDGSITGIPEGELGIYKFTVTETSAGKRVLHSYTITHIYQGAVDVEQFNKPGYGFVTTRTDDGRVDDQTVSSVYELTSQIMHLQGPFSEFRALYLDAQYLVPNYDYIAEEGSTIITVLESTLARAGGGTHTLVAMFMTGQGSNKVPVYTVQNFTISGIRGKTINVLIKGKPVVWWDAEPVIDENSRTITPIRIIGEALGLTVDWNGTNREASFSDGGRTIYFPIDSRAARTSDGKDVQMDTAAVIRSGGRTFAPVRYLAEYFGYTVDWDGNTRTVSIS